MAMQYKHTGLIYPSGPTKLFKDGARVEVIIRPPLWQIVKMNAAGQQPKKKMKKTEALIDTGATLTCIRDEMAQELNLKRVASGKIYSVARSHKCAVYTAELEMGPFKFLRSIVGMPAKNLEYNCLLGRDLLDRFTLVYSGPAKQFWLIDGIIAWKLALPPESPPIKGNTGP